MPAHPERNLLTTNGVTHALDLIARHLVKPGDTVLVEDPAWFLIFGRLAAFGARLIGVPRGPDGPDTALLDQLAAEHKPKLFIINSAVHNPTGHTLSAGIAYEILRIAERHDFLVIEDDTYGDLHPGGAMKLAVLDRLRRVILVSGYSKMLAASLRVGYVAAHPDILQKLADLKMLAGLTSPELGERVIHRVLMEGQYRRHAERVRARVDEARRRCVQGLTALGLTVPREPHAGMFVWADCGRDSEVLAREAADQGLLLAPGTLFSPSQAPSSMVRFSVTMVDHNDIWAKLEKLFMPGLSCNNNGQHSTWKEPPCPHRSSPLPRTSPSRRNWAPTTWPMWPPPATRASSSTVRISRAVPTSRPPRTCPRPPRPPACGSNTSRSSAAP